MPAAKKGTLQLRLHAPATPQHVAVAASMFRDLVSAVRADLPETSVTMVVTNFNMTAGLRYQDQSGRNVLDSISRLIREPVKAVHQRPSLTAAADVLSQYAPQLEEYRPEFWSSKKLLKRFDTDFVDALSLVREERSRLVLRGDTVIRSQVFRAGRTSGTKSIAARVTIGKGQQDIRIKKGCEGPFFDFAKSGVVCAVRVEAAWFRDENGRLELDAKRSRLAAVAPWKSGVGDDLMREVREYPTVTVRDAENVLDEVGRF